MSIFFKIKGLGSTGTISNFAYFEQQKQQQSYRKGINMNKFDKSKVSQIHSTEKWI